MSTKLDLSFAEDIIDKYEKKFNYILKPYDIDSVLTFLMYEKNIMCEEEEFQEILQKLIYKKNKK